MPFIFLAAFLFIYMMAILRSLFAVTIGYRISQCLKLKYRKPLESDGEDSDNEEVKKSKIFSMLKGLFRGIANLFIWVRNFSLWSIRQKSSLLEMSRFFNKIVGAYLSFISFFFLRIMTTSFQIFGCDLQPNGIYTFKESPDITWFVYSLLI
jgi:hypothetical protein